MPSATEQNRLAVVGFVDQFPSQADLTLFMNHFASHVQVTATFTTVQVNGGMNDMPQQANTEIQYTAPMASPTLLILYSIGGGIEWTPDGVLIAGDMYLEWLDHILGELNTPQTISMAYSGNELDLPRGICGGRVPTVPTALCTGRQCPHREWCQRWWELRRQSGKCPVHRPIS